MTPEPSEPNDGSRRPRLAPLISVIAAVVVAVVVVIITLGSGSASSGGAQVVALATNPDLDPGTTLSGRAPDFTLGDQFGQSVSLRAYRGRVVILAFNDSQCTTVCPLTTSSMVEAKGLLGSAGNQVALLGVNANPTATATRWVRAYSQVHGMLHQWRFLTGSPAQLKRVWHAYHIEARIDQGQIDHTPAVYIIDRAGRLAKIYLTQMDYSSVSQQAEVLAREVSALLPDHPRLRSTVSVDYIPSIAPTDHVSLPRFGGGAVALGPSRSPRLVVFFASWLTETMPLGTDLEALNRYESAPGRPAPLTAVDEASVEPSAGALPRFMRGVSHLSYPVAIDRSGRVADGYQAQDQPWFVLTSSSGRILWYWDASTQGWPSTAVLTQHVRAALSAPALTAPRTATATRHLLAGSPPALAALHDQAATLLGSHTALTKRLRALHGFPIVLSAWASWCPNCATDSPLFASASVSYGRQVAFVGVDTDDYSTVAARAFLAAHPVSYPSYQSTSDQLAPLAGIVGLPTTIFISAAGKVTCVRSGRYASIGALNDDIKTCALGE